jgi:hypothetical protein
MNRISAKKEILMTGKVHQQGNILQPIGTGSVGSELNYAQPF